MSMWGGYGSLGDFYITNATEGETEARNTEFDTVTGAILMFYQDDCFAFDRLRLILFLLGVRLR